MCRSRLSARPVGLLVIARLVAPGGDTRDVLAASFDTTHPGAGPTGHRAVPVTEPGARTGVLVALRPAENAP